MRGSSSISDTTLVTYYSHFLEWRHQVQKKELKRPVVGLPSDFTELCRQEQNYLTGGMGMSGIVCTWC